MKKNIFNLLCLLAVTSLSLISCGSDDPVKEDGGGVVGPVEPGENEVAFGENVSVEAIGKTLSIVFETSGTWNMTASKGWMTLDNKNGGAGRQTITLTLDPYTDVYNTREGKLTLKVQGETESRMMTIVQNPAAKEMHLEMDTLNYEYNRDAKEIKASVKMVSNFAWKVKKYPSWMSEPQIVEGEINTNLKDSTELNMSLILNNLTVNALNDSIEFVDPKEGDNAPVLGKLYVNFAGMGMASITWEREAFQRTDPQEDLQFGVLFNAKSGGNAVVRYTNDDYEIKPGVSRYPKRVDYVYFYVKTPIEFDYSTVEEAQQYFDIFALNASEDPAYPANNESAPVKIEMTDDVEFDANPKFKRRYWKFSVSEDNPTCLRRRFLVYVLPKGTREKLFVNGQFNKAEYEIEGRNFTQCGGVVANPNFRCEGLIPVSYEGVPMGNGVYLGKENKSVVIDIYTDDPYVLKESGVYTSSGGSFNIQKDWIRPDWSQDPNDPKHVKLTLKYNDVTGNDTQVSNLKIMFMGDAYPDGLIIQKNIIVVRK